MAFQKMAVTMSVFCMIVLCSFTLGYKEGCEDLFFQCQRQGFGNSYGQELQTAPWPMTDEYLNTHRSLAEVFCRAVNESGKCYRDLNERCPGIFVHLQVEKVAAGWFHAEVLMAAAKLCGVSRGILPFARTAMDCGSKSQDFRQLVDWRHYEATSPDAAAAHRNLCEVLVRLEERLNGTTRADLVGQCGEEAVNVLVKAMADVHNLHCRPAGQS